jgi:hypothetical protein
MEVILIMWGISALLIVLMMSFEHYIDKLDNSCSLKKWWRRHVIGDMTDHLH